MFIKWSQMNHRSRSFGYASVKVGNVDMQGYLECYQASPHFAIVIHNIFYDNENSI